MVSADVLRGKKIIGAKGSLIGTLDGIELNIADWKATHIRVHLTDDIAKKMGFKRGVTSFINRPIISMPIDSIDQVGDVITIKDTIKSVEDLELVKPTCI